MGIHTVVPAVLGIYTITRNCEYLVTAKQLGGLWLCFDSDALKEYEADKAQP